MPARMECGAGPSYDISHDRTRTGDECHMRMTFVIPSNRPTVENHGTGGHMTTAELTETTIGQLAVEMPIAIRVFEAWKIDYCCGGKTPLPEALRAAGKSVDAFLEGLARLSTAPAAGFDWQSQTLTTMAR